MMMFPSVLNFKNAMKMNCMHNCPVTADNINVAKETFGKDIFTLKGKTARQSPFAVTIDTTETPPEIVELHNNIFGASKQ